MVNIQWSLSCMVWSGAPSRIWNSKKIAYHIFRCECVKCSMDRCEQKEHGDFLTSSGRNILKCLSSSSIIDAQICVSVMPFGIPSTVCAVKICLHSVSSIAFISYFRNVISCLWRIDRGTLYNLNGHPVIETDSSTTSDTCGKQAGRMCSVKSSDWLNWTRARLL